MVWRLQKHHQVVDSFADSYNILVTRNLVYFCLPCGEEYRIKGVYDVDQELAVAVFDIVG